MDDTDAWKILLLGDSGTGKTNVWRVLGGNEFVEEHNKTLGVEASAITRELRGEDVRFELYDTAGLDTYRTDTSNYFGTVDGALIVFDMTDEGTWSNANGWLNEMKKYGKDTCAVVLVGNKCDASNCVVDRGVVNEFAVNQDVEVVFVSAKNGEGIDNILSTLYDQLSPDTSSDAREKEKASSGGGGCCVLC
eukprot:TRINITY_DN4446_c0_g1_i3.p1 TRINITY_DN4446_c0_g1~~TRINITY_DN4446_c0_g1_i3.p1  ORF type:complete len:192 (-),score=52.65 TRINITY_DN4446_c0_g1_i3:404-979(-)